MSSHSHVFKRHCHADLPIISHGQGCYLYDQQGRQYLDGSGGAAVSCLGHDNEHIKQVLRAQLEQVAFAHTGFFTSEPAEQLAAKLAAHAPGNLNWCYFVSGGSEAMEAALKLARQYFLEIGQPQRQRIIARQQSYHGNTLGALATGGNQWRRQPFASMLAETSHIPPCYAYRLQQEHETAYEYGQRAANYLEQEILRLGADTVMAFVAEPVVGATSGAVPAVAGYFQRIRQICDQYGVLLILDEVMCGMGRTGSLFASEQDAVVADMLITAKGLGAGYQPLGVMLASEQIYQAVAQGSGFFQHGHTYMGHPMACAAGLAVMEVLLDQGVLAGVADKGASLMALLQSRLGGHPHVGDIRGKGLFLGIELVADKASKEPFDAGMTVHKQIKQQAFANGLICYPMGGTIDGSHGDHILLAPPYIMQQQHMQELVDKLSDTIDEVTL
jgi:adenosylmethionine-8-amino-7-oxononanoate aminotransferase